MDDAWPGLNIMDNNETLSDQNYFLLRIMERTSNHCMKARNDHIIDFENGRIIDRGDYRTRKTLESWHTTNTKDADNNSKPLPEPYLILLN